MTDPHPMELKQALIAVFATAASMGIDIDELSELAASDLTDEEMVGWFNQFKPGAVREPRYCRDLAKGGARRSIAVRLGRLSVACDVASGVPAFSLDPLVVKPSK